MGVLAGLDHNLPCSKFAFLSEGLQDSFHHLTLRLGYGCLDFGEGGEYSSLIIIFLLDKICFSREFWRDVNRERVHVFSDSIDHFETCLHDFSVLFTMN